MLISGLDFIGALIVHRSDLPTHITAKPSFTKSIYHDNHMQRSDYNITELMKDNKHVNKKFLSRLYLLRSSILMIYTVV